MVRISVELPDEVAERLLKAAGERQSSPERLLAEAARAMLDDSDELRRSIARGVADLEAGRTHAHEDVMAEMEAWARDVVSRRRGEA